MIAAASVLCVAILHGAPQAPPAAEAALRAAVEEFYRTQEREDVEGYLALWSSRAQRPSAEQLKYIFDTGDDRFSEIHIARVTPRGDRVSVRVESVRERTVTPPDGAPPRLFTTRILAALTFEREGGAWKLVREGQPADDLAAELMDAATDEEREAMLEAESDLVGPHLLTALARLGGVASVRQDYSGALTIYQQLALVARRGGFRKEEAEALQNIANALYFLRRYPEALSAYEQRLAIERERGDDAGIAAALSGIATIRYSYAEYTEALARYRDALAIQERIDDVEGIAFISISIGNIAYLQGDYQAAIAAYSRSFELNQRMSNADGESRALEGLGRVYLAQGDYAGALESFEAVLADTRLGRARARLGSAAQNAGEVHFRLGNLDAARRRYEESRAHFEATQDPSNVGRVIQALALTELAAGRFALAEDLYTRSGGICLAAGDQACSAGATAGLAYAQTAQEKYWDAAASYRKAVIQFESLGRREEVARAEIGLSQALAGAEDAAGAIAAAIRARHIALAIDSDDMMWRALTAEARAVRKLGDTARALGIAQAALGAIERMQAAALDTPGGSVPAEATGALATLAVLQAEAGDPAGAFRTSERLRGLDVRAGLATNEREIARGMSDDERAEERTLAAQVLTRLAQATRERGLPKPDAARLAALEKNADEAKEARRSWMRRLFERHPHLRVWRGLAPSRDTADAARVVIAPGEMILSFVLDDEDLLVLTVRRQEDESGVLPPLVITSHVTHVNRRYISSNVLALQQAAAQNDTRAWREALGALAALLPDAVHAGLASASKIMILAHDVLWRVPFEALPSGDGVLGDHAVISVAGSLDSLIHSDSLVTPGAAAVTRMVGLGAPEVSANRIARFGQIAPGWILRPADSADRELQTVASVYPADAVSVLSRASASEAAFREQRKVDVLHVAAPFRINAASPLFSPIVLSSDARPTAPSPGAASETPRTTAPPETAESTAPITAGAASSRRPKDDGSLELREVMNLDVGARVVIFSDGAATSMRDGAAAADVLQWGWLSAGVPTLLVARWTAPPTAGAQLLAEFHRRLHQGAAPGAALAAAQHLVRSNPETAAPLYWAGWLLVGR